MNLLHISDLHLGKRIYEFSMLEEQKDMLGKILDLVDQNEVEALLVAGDIYDKSVPPVEAVDIFDAFITGLARRNVAVLVIAGNHDSPERLSFGSRIMNKHNVWFAGDCKGQIPGIRLQDGYGAINIYLMSYLRPSAALPALGALELNRDERNILLAHQFFIFQETGPELSGSENSPECRRNASLSLGGLDGIDASLLDGFDYVALGHIHRPQKIGRDTVRYSGSPLQYSFAECRHQKSAVLIRAGAKGNLTYSLLELKPRRGLAEIRCPLSELGAQSVPKDNYVHVTLTDENMIIDAIGKVREIYPRVMLLDYDNTRSRAEISGNPLSDADIQEKTPLQLFEGFFRGQNGAGLTENQLELFARAAEGAEHET
jgi:exonuclease SbcD